MGFEKEKMKQIRSLIVFVAFVILLLMYSKSVFGWVGMFLGILTPFAAGGAIAFVLNLPLRGIENHLLKRWNGKVAKKIKRPCCILLSIIFVVAIVAFVVVMVVPQLQQTVLLLGQQIPVFFTQMGEQLDVLGERYPYLQEQLNGFQLENIDWNNLWNTVGSFLTTGMTNVLSSAYSVASSIIGGVVNTFISIVFAIYILMQKERLADQGHRILDAYLPEKVCGGIEHVLFLLHKNFGSFITGQCLEAVILGSMFVVALTIFRFPYALLIGVLIAFMALIPLVGAFVGCILGAFLILMESPIQALWFIILFLVIQQIEGNLIYPHVVGGSVGLPSLWVLAAVSVGGSLFGILGMLCFIPLVSTGYALLRESVNGRNQRRLEAQAVPEEESEEEQKTDTDLSS